MAVDIEKTRFHLSGLSLVLKKIDWPGGQSDLRYTPLVEVYQAINSLVFGLDKEGWSDPKHRAILISLFLFTCRTSDLNCFIFPLSFSIKEGTG